MHVMLRIFEEMKKILSRVSYYLKVRRLPWRYKWIKYFFIGLIHNPKIAFRFKDRIKSREMSFKMFIFQIFALRILKESMAISNNVGIKPFLNYGSILGYCREGDFIMTDDDIDYGILDDDTKKIPALIEEMKKNGYTVRKESPLEISFAKKQYHDVYVDYWYYFKNKNGTKIFAGSFPQEPDLVCIHPYPIDVLSKLKEVEFKSVKILIPEQTEKFIEWTYGINWKTPLNFKEANLGYLEKQKIMHPNVMRISLADFKNHNFLND